MFRPPGQNRQGIRVGMQEKVGMALIAEACNGRRVEGDTIFKCPLQLLRVDGDIFGPAENIAESQADELHILLFHELNDLLRCVFH